MNNAGEKMQEELKIKPTCSLEPPQCVNLAELAERTATPLLVSPAAVRGCFLQKKKKILAKCLQFATHPFVIADIMLVLHNPQV